MTANMAGLRPVFALAWTAVRSPTPDRVPLRRQTVDPAVGAIDPDCVLGLYVHYPFCSVRCPYCDFAIDTRQDIPHTRYADAVVAEIQARALWFRPPRSDRPPLVSIYFGGGTPGLWPAPHIRRVIETARAVLAPVADKIEITVEANPSEITDEHLHGLRAAGVNRLSLGMQAFDDESLRAIGRNHDGAQAIAGFHRARAAGFANLSCDLMFGLPGQTWARLERSLDVLVDLGPEHVSCYGLTIERGTPFGHLDRAGQLRRPGDDEMADFYRLVQTRLAVAGHFQYEVSSFARGGARAVHNQLYWAGGAYLGVGCSASSFRPLDDGTGYRFTNPRATDTYMAAVEKGGGNPAPAQVERRNARDLANEFFWLGLRTADGVDRVAYRARHGADPLDGAARHVQAERLQEAGWLRIEPGRVALTSQGFLFADEVAARLCF